MFNARILLGVLALHTVSSISGRAGDWPQFRGTHGSGVVENQKPPVNFGPDQSVLWKSAIPGGASSPCIIGDDIFLTAFADGKLETLCINRHEGEIRWRRTVPTDELEKFHPREGSPASATPASDGRRVVVYFASFGLLAYDLQGKELWRLPLPIPAQVGDFGSGASPILHQGRILLNRDQLEGAHLLAVDVESGKVIWRTDRPGVKSSFGSPVVWSQGDRQDVVLAGMTQLKAYDFETGKERWLVRGLPTAVCTTPVVADGLLYFAGWSPGKSDSPMPDFDTIATRLDKNGDGAVDLTEADEGFKTFFASYDSNRDESVTAEEWQYFLDMLAAGKNVAIAVRSGGIGDITDSHVVWKYSRGLPYVPSPLVHGGRVYFVKDGGMLTSLDAASGRPVYKQERLGTMGAYYASPVSANGNLYLTSLNGVISVVPMGDEFEVLARNDLGERIAATPAIVDDKLYVRTAGHFYAFGQ